MKRFIPLSLAALFLGLYALPTPVSFAKKPHYKHRIEVDATAKLEVSPDVVDLMLTLQSSQETPKAALEELEKQTKTLVDALLKAGLPNKDLRISYLTIRPRYARRKHYDDPQKIEGYTAQKTLIACIKNPNKLGAFVTAAASAGTSELTTKFRSTKIAEHRGALRKMAMDAAWKKAQELSTSGKFPLGHILSIAEVQRGWRPSHANAFSYKSSASGRGVHPNAIPISLTLRVVFVTP